MTTKTFPYAVIYKGVFYPANTPITVVEEVKETKPIENESVEEVKETKPKGRRKNDN